jgi:arylformamidase
LEIFAAECDNTRMTRIMIALLGCSMLSCASTPPPAKEPAVNARPWESLDKAALDKSYNNSAAVPESAQMFKGWLAKSQELRAKYSGYLDLPYGPRPRNKVDFFSAGEGTPVLVFFHGGFWQMRSREDFAFLAESFLNQCISVAMVGYPLGPDATMDEIVADAHAAIRYLVTEVPKMGGDPKRMVVVGWSSGGHLATEVLDEPSLQSGVAISGIYELEPLVKSYINDKLHLDVATAQRNSPMLELAKTKSSKQLSMFAGSAELSEMRRQSDDYAKARKAAGLPVSFEWIAEANHYTILNSMMSADGKIHQAIVAQLGK